MRFDPQNTVCWIVSEGMAGTENQCIGIAEALGLTPVIKRIGLTEPWKTFSPWLGFEQARTFTPRLEAPWPDILIAAGRKSVAASRYVRKMSSGRTFTVQVQDPKTASSQFDLVAVPAHDALRGGNVLVTDGAPNRVTPSRLAEAKARFAGLFENMPSPRVAVLIGGKSKAHDLPPAVAASLGASLAALPASLMITASRRTGEPSQKAFMEAVKSRPDAHPAWHWDGSGENPYTGMLAWADYIVVTEDSVSMLSDAGTTGKPVFVAGMQGGSRRLSLFHAHMQARGVSRPFDGRLENWAYEPLSDAENVAREIAARVSARGV